MQQSKHESARQAHRAAVQAWHRKESPEVIKTLGRIALKALKRVPEKGAAWTAMMTDVVEMLSEAEYGTFCLLPR